MSSSETPGGSPSWQGPLYLDASALAKLYLPELGSEELDAALSGRRDLVVSDLAITEIVSAFARRCREGTASSDAARQLHGTILRDMRAGIYLHVDLHSTIHMEAERLLLSATDVPMGTSHALHLALASSARASAIITYDAGMAAVASSFGLSAHPQS
jgi:predicted nucleic acid-binding protein